LLVDVRHRWISNARVAHRRADVSQRENRVSRRHGIGRVVGRSGGVAAAAGPLVRSTALRRNFLADRGGAAGRDHALAVAQRRYGAIASVAALLETPPIVSTTACGPAGATLGI